MGPLPLRRGHGSENNFRLGKTVWMCVAHNPRRPVHSPLPARGRGARLNERPSVKTTRTVERFSMS